MEANDKVLVRKLIDMLIGKEWAYRHAAENRYCPECANEDDAYVDQKYHHEGCEFVALINEARKRVL